MPKTGRPKAELVLTDEERETLTRLSRRAKSSQARALRCRIVFACAEGLANLEGSQRLGVTRPTVGKWRCRFVRDRVDGVTEWPRPVLPMMPGMPEQRTHDYVRNGITTLFAAFDTATGEVISSVHRRHRAVEFKKFLTKIDKEVPEHLDIHLICDNYGTHKTPAIKAWLDRHPRFHMHFTPTGSSWVNQVERWFGFLDEQMIRRGAHK